MSNRYLLSVFSCFAIGLCCLLSCKKESIDNGDNGFPIQLTTEQDGRNIILNWTETNITDFEQYIIVRSSSPIPDDPTPSGQTIASLDDYKTTNLEDNAVPLSESIYYKVYVKLGERFLFSPTVEVKSNIKLWNIQPSRVLFDKEHKRMFIFDANQGKVYRYNYQSELLEDSISFTSSFDLRMAIGNHGNGDELYIAPNNGTSDVKIYNPDNFQSITSIFIGSYIYSIASGNNGFIYVGSDNWQRSISIYKRSTKQFVSSDSSFGGFGDSNLKVMSSDGFTVVQTSSNQVIRYSINSQGQIENLEFAFINSNFFSFFQHIVKSDDNQLFCFESGGTILKSDLQVAFVLSGVEFLFFMDLAFSNDNSQVFGITNAGEFLEMDLATNQVNKRFSLAYSPSRIERDGNEILIVGMVFDNFGFSKTIIDKLKID